MGCCVVPSEDRGEDLGAPTVHVPPGYRNTSPDKIKTVNRIRRIFHCKMHQLNNKLIPMLYTHQKELQQMSGTEFTETDDI